MLKWRLHESDRTKDCGKSRGVLLDCMVLMVKLFNHRRKTRPSNFWNTCGKLPTTTFWSPDLAAFSARKIDRKSPCGRTLWSTDCCSIPSVINANILQGFMRKQTRGIWSQGSIPLCAQANESLGSWWQSLRYGRSCLRHANLHHGSHGVVEGAPRILPGGHLDNHAAVTPNVRLAAIAGTFDNLWSHPGDGAPHRVTQGVRIRGTLGASKVRQLGMTFQIHQDISTLNVSMHHRWVMGVEVFQAFQNLLGIWKSQGLLEAAKLLRGLR